MNVLDIIGKKSGRLTVIEKAVTRNQKSYWLCLCECGNKVEVIGSNINNGNTQSCGCLQKERTSKAKFKHGLTSTPEYYAWVNMKTRCYNETVEDYPDYGGRGIIVCDRWLGDKGFENFLSDMGKKPSPGHSVDRINTNGIYEKDNCRWGTEEQQVRNKRNNVWIECNGIKMILSDWARYFGVDQGNLAASIKAKGIYRVYEFYLEKHGILPSKTQYIPPCKAHKRRKFLPFDELKYLSSQLLTALDNTP